MSKATELRLLQRQRSADAPISYHHRSGDSEGSGGSMIDFYAQEASAEEAYFEEQEDSSREVFARAFKLYLKKTLSGKERKFLSRILSGREKPQEVGRALGVKWFEYMQEIQRKAFSNAEAFGRVVQLSGWSRAEMFAGAVFGRLKELQRRGEAEELPRSKKQAQARAMMKAFRESADEEWRTNRAFQSRLWRQNHREYCAETNRKWREANPEKAREKVRRWCIANKERRAAQQRDWQIRNKEKCAEYSRRYQEKRKLSGILSEQNPKQIAPEKIAEYQRKWREKNSEKMAEYRRKWREANKEKNAEYNQQWREKNSEYGRQWREANKEYIKKAKRAYREKKNAEKAAAKALAELMTLSQQCADTERAQGME